MTLRAPRDAPLPPGQVPQNVDPIPTARSGTGSPGTAAASRPSQGRAAERGWPLPLLLPPHRFPAIGRGRRGSRRALTDTDGVGEAPQSLPQQPRQQQREGPGRALPHPLHPLRLSPYSETGTGIGETGDSQRCQRRRRCWRRWRGGWSPSFRLFFFILSFSRSPCSGPHPSLAGLIGCAIAALPGPGGPPAAQGLPPKMEGIGAEAAPPGPGGVIDHTRCGAGWRLRSAPGGLRWRPRSGLGAEGAHPPHSPAAGPGCGCRLTPHGPERV